MTDTLRDRLSTDPRSPFYHEALLARGIGIRFNGKERHDVGEYCASEGWIRLAMGKALDRRATADAAADSWVSIRRLQV